MKQSSKKHELGTAALYCRLSRDDNMDSESNSIQNQRKILQKAAKDKGYTDTVFFVDDGITGTTMKRPGFQKMLTAIEAGYISAVFVKDLSRLGRNYIEVGKLTEEFFPLHDVRLVAVVPFRGQECRFRSADRTRWERIVAGADAVEFLAEGYHPGCYAVRNRHLVAHASLVVAWYDGSPGGTQYTVREALRGGRELINLHPDVQLSIRPVDPRLF